MSNQLPYVSLHSGAQADVPLHDYCFPVNGYVSLMGFASLPLFQQGRIRSQQSEIQFDTTLEPYRLHERWVLKSSSFNRVIDGSRDDSDDPVVTEMRHSQYRQFLRVPRNKSTTPTPPQGDILYVINGEDYQPTAALEYWVAEEMQLRSRYPLSRPGTRKEQYSNLETIFESTRLPYTMKHTDEAHSRLHST